VFVVDGLRHEAGNNFLIWDLHMALKCLYDGTCMLKEVCLEYLWFVLLMPAS
jgi:hypothetical protein